MTGTRIFWTEKRRSVLIGVLKVLGHVLLLQLRELVLCLFFFKGKRTPEREPHGSIESKQLFRLSKSR